MTKRPRFRTFDDLPPELQEEIRRLAPLGRALFEADDQREALGLLDEEDEEDEDVESDSATQEAMARLAAVLMGDLPLPREDPRLTRLRAKMEDLQIRLAELQIAAQREGLSGDSEAPQAGDHPNRGPEGGAS